MTGPSGFRTRLVRDGDSTNRETTMDLEATRQGLATPTLQRKLSTPTLDRKLGEAMNGLRETLDVPAIRKTLEDPDARDELRAYLMEGEGR